MAQGGRLTTSRGLRDSTKMKRRSPFRKPAARPTDRTGMTLKPSLSDASPFGPSPSVGGGRLDAPYADAAHDGFGGRPSDRHGTGQLAPSATALAPGSASRAPSSSPADVQAARPDAPAAVWPLASPPQCSPANH